MNKFLNKKILISFLLASLSPIVITGLYLYLDVYVSLSDIYWISLHINAGIILNYLLYPTIDAKDILSIIPFILMIRYVFVYTICKFIDDKKAAYFFSLLMGIFTGLSGFLLVIQTA